MSAIFLKIANMSISASYLVLVVLALRVLLKKAPKWVCVLLWGLVAVRLVCPFSVESALSLIPSSQTIPDTVLTGPSFDVQTGIDPVDTQVNEYLADHYFEGVTVPVDNGVNMAPDGHMLTGWQLVNGIWYYLGTNGAMVSDGWQAIDGQWYYFDASGAMQSGWIFDGSWYYLGESGAMHTGWLLDNGTWYYLNPGNGAMVTGGQWIDGTYYWFNQSGAWVG